MEDEINQVAKKLSKHKIMSLLLLIFISLTMGFTGGWLGAKSRNHELGIDQATQAQLISSESELISRIANRVGESVVSVNVTSRGIRNDFMGYGGVVEQQSAGTGIIITEEGLVITNRHVVPEGITSVSLTLFDGTELTDVEVVGRTRANDSLDIAFLKVKDNKGKKLKPAGLGDSSKVRVGDRVIAIGNALGEFSNTVTEGIISGYGRSIIAGDGSNSETLQNLFQTDAAINQGNSGGPLVNIDGHVIGINTAVAADGAENIGFAIPIDDVRGMIASVVESGKLVRPYLGVRYITLNEGVASELGIEQKTGAYIVEGSPDEPSILENSPASKAGLQARDVIVAVNNEAIDSRHTLTSLLSKRKVGDKVKLKVVRDGKEIEIKVQLEALPEN